MAILPKLTLYRFNYFLIRVIVNKKHVKSIFFHGQSRILLKLYAYPGFC